MKKFICFLLCCAVPVTADAAGLFNFNDSFDIAKAVKLGRGSRQNSQNWITLGGGGAQIAKECDNNCSVCDTATGKCSTCKTGYIVSNGTCVQEKSCVSQCSECNKLTGVCSACKSPYLISGNVCVQEKSCDTNCSDCNILTEVCSACKSGYLLSSNSCVQEKGCDANCSDCNTTTGICSACNTGFSLENGSCQASACAATGYSSGYGNHARYYRNLGTSRPTCPSLGKNNSWSVKTFGQSGNDTCYACVCEGPVLTDGTCCKTGYVTCGGYTSCGECCNNNTASCGVGKKCSNLSCVNCPAGEKCFCPDGQVSDGSGGCKTGS